MDTMTVSDKDGHYFYEVTAKKSAGQMIFTIRKFLNETGEIVTSQSLFENRYGRTDVLHSQA